MRRMRLLEAVIAICLALISSPALAQSGLYVSATGGGLFPNDWSSDSGTRVGFKTGYSILGAVGLSIGLIGLRIEAEGGYRESDVDKVSVAGVNLGGSGSAKVESGMVNAYFEVPYSISALKPYIGAGVGAARVFGSNVATAAGSVIDGHDTVLAYQAMAGLAYSMNAHVTVNVGYRFFATDTTHLSGAVAGVAVPVKQNGLKTHSAELGLRFTF
jgi:OmpA-OmpF porin, OOP family